MKKNKIILLTILIMLVIYCGAVIFVTKPEGLDVSSWFTYTASMTNEDKAEVKADVTSELKKELSSEIDASVETAVDKKVSEAVAPLESKLAELKEAVAAAESKEAVVQVIEEAEVDLEALASQLYTTYKDELVAEIVEAVLAQLPDQTAQTETPVEIVEETPVETPVEEVVEAEPVETETPVEEVVEEVPAEAEVSVETEIPAEAPVEEVVETETPVEEVAEPETPVEAETTVEAPVVEVAEESVQPTVDEVLNNMTDEERASMSKEQYDALREQVRDEQINDVLSKLN